MKKIKYCSYCGDLADSKDHIPSRNLLEKPYPDNLFTIYACKKCNQSFSLDEELFLHSLAEISDSPNLLARKLPGGNIYKARERSKKLKERINESLIKDENGLVYFIPEWERISKVIEKNAFGLYFHRYKKIANLSSFKCIGFYPFNPMHRLEGEPAEIFLLTYSEKFIPKKWTSIQKNVFSYIVVRDWRRNNKLIMIFKVHNSVWCLVEIPSPSRYIKL